MAAINNPDGDGSIEVEVIDSASHHGEYVQVQATDGSVSLSDESGEAPWMDADDVEGL